MRSNSLKKKLNGSVLVMMSDLVDAMGTDLNNNILSPTCPVFYWPQHSFLIEHFRDNRPTLSSELQLHLENLEIFSEEVTTNVDGKISSAARKCGLVARKKIWFTFDIFLSRNRPGLLSDPEAGLPKRKRKRRGKRKSKKGKPTDEGVTQDDDNEEEVSKDDIIGQSMMENILPILEEELFVRAI